MPVSGKTASPFEIPFLTESDIPDMGAGDEAIAKRVHALFGEVATGLAGITTDLANIAPGQIVGGSAGKLLIAGSTGAAAYKAMKGDATLAEDGTLTLSDSVKGTSLFHEAAVTRTNTALGAFSTPLKLELPAVEPNQLIEVFVGVGLVQASVESNAGAGGAVGLAIGSKTAASSLYGINGNVAVGSNSSFPICTAPTASGPFGHWGGLEGPDGRNGFLLNGTGPQPQRFIRGASATETVTVELLGRCIGGGTITVERVWMFARVSG